VTVSRDEETGDQCPLDNSIISTTGRRLKPNLFWTVIGTGTYQGSQFLMISMLAKLTNPGMVGEYALAFAICAPVFILANLNLKGVQATDARRDYSSADYLALRLVMSFFALTVVLLAGGALSPDRPTFLVVMSVGIAKTFESLSDVTYGLLQRHERMDLIARSLILKAVISLALFGGAVYLTREVIWGTFALAVTWGLVFAFNDVAVGERVLLRDLGHGIGRHSSRRLLPAVLSPRWDLTTGRRLFWLALPLGVGTAILSLEVNIPRYFVEHYLGHADLGVYAALVYLTTTITLLIDAMGQSIGPRMSRLYAAGNMEAFHKITVKFLLGNAVVSTAWIVIAIFAGRLILNLVYGPEYAQVGVFAVLMVAWAQYGYGSVAGFALTAARKFREQVPPLIISTVGILVASIVLIPHGLMGAAVATLIAMVLRSVGQFYVLIKLGLFSARWGRSAARQVSNRSVT